MTLFLRSLLPRRSLLLVAAVQVQLPVILLLATRVGERDGERRHLVGGSALGPLGGGWGGEGKGYSVEDGFGCSLSWKIFNRSGMTGSRFKSAFASEPGAGGSSSSGVVQTYREAFGAPKRGLRRLGLIPEFLGPLL